MISTLIFGIVLAIFLFFSLRERIRLRKMREKDWESIGETKTSVMSQAITSLVGTAGGIYLSMVILFSFMEVELPSRVSFVGMSFEPLAAISFGLALVQPFATRAIKLSRRR